MKPAEVDALVALQRIKDRARAGWRRAPKADAELACCDIFDIASEALAARPAAPPVGEGLPRYGMTWQLSKPSQPLLTPMPDGYWTPWHLAVGEAERLLRDGDASRLRNIADAMAGRVDWEFWQDAMVDMRAIAHAIDQVAALASPAPQPAIDGMRAAIQQWAIYCFNHHGDDANLYNGLAELGGVDLDGKGWIPPAAPAPVRCPNCGGMGETTHDILVGGTEHDTEQRECDVCKGTGLAAPAPVEPPPASQEALPCKNCRGFDTLCNRCGGSGYVVVARRKAQE
jgi:hypothetical protein